MATPKLTIAQVLDAFLAEQKARLSAKTWSRYESSISLFKAYLESYFPGHDGEYSAVTRKGGTYCSTYGPEDIPQGFSEFLSYFMPHKVMGSNETMKAAATVVKNLRKWLAEKGYAGEEEIEDDYVEDLARNLPATQKLLDLLDAHIDQTLDEDCDNPIEGHFTIQRIERGVLWLEPLLGGPSLGPFELPEEITRNCKAGWDIGGAVAQTSQGWQFVEVWNLSP